jgi:hypothetical protein
MPFATDLVAEYGDVPIAVVIYASIVGTASLTSWLMVRRSVTHGHIREKLRPYAEAWASPRGLGPTLVFLVSVPVAFVSGDAALAIWLLTFLPAIRGAIPAAAE